jgi:hypothetical protein
MAISKAGQTNRTGAWLNPANGAADVLKDLATRPATAPPALARNRPGTAAKQAASSPPRSAVPAGSLVATRPLFRGGSPSGDAATAAVWRQPTAVATGAGPTRPFKSANSNNPPVLTLSSSTGQNTDVPLTAAATRTASQQVLPAASYTWSDKAREFAANASKLQTYLNSLPPASVDMEVRRLLYAAVNDPSIDNSAGTSTSNNAGNTTATALLGQLQSLGISTTAYAASLKGFQQSRADRLAHRGDLPPEAQRTAQRSISPPTREIQTGEASSTEVVPQNTSAMVKPGDMSVRQLVTKEVYDCVVVTYWDPVTKAGGLAHIPAGSTADLSALNAELKSQGLSAGKLKFSVLGGVDYASSMAPDTGQLVPSALWKIQSIQRQLSKLGVPPSSVALHTLHSHAEVTTGNKSNIGINLDTGQTFFFSDPKRVLPNPQDRGYGELQDRTTDLYTVNRGA